MDALEVRAAAAADLARKGLLDGALALSYVLFPTEAVEAASEAVAAEGAVRGRHSERTRLRGLTTRRRCSCSARAVSGASSAKSLRCPESWPLRPRTPRR